jgi:uroporphyrinogen decarboxylase
VDYTPVWFMRQAGRYLPGYREIRKNYGVLEAAKTPKVCRDITLMPVKELGVDAAVMFADIMLPLEGVGVKFRIEENVGPIIENPIASLEDVEKIRDFNPKEHVPYILEAIQLIRAGLDNHALVGFAGAPFTVASYLIEGGPSREFAKTKKVMFDDRETWNLLMSKLTEMTSEYLSAQIDAGVDAVQLFDSWVGTLSPEDYEEYVSPFVMQVFGFIKKNHSSTSKIHFGTNTLHLLPLMKDNGGDVFSVDWRMPLDEAREIVGESFGIQGNLEPAVLLARDTDFIARRAQQVLDENGGRNGHVFNLGHGILRNTPVENAKFVVDYVHNH